METERTAGLEIASRIQALLESNPQPALAPFLRDWPRHARMRACAARRLPVLRWLAQMETHDAPFDHGLTAAVCRAAPSLAWCQTYAASDLGGTFLDNYAWSEIVGGRGPVASEHIACGFLLLGPATHYPRHRHDAEEVYLPLHGTAAWQQGDAVWRERPPGTWIHHAGDEPHAMRTGLEPLLALYLWRGTNISGKARLEDPVQP